MARGKYTVTAVIVDNETGEEQGRPVNLVTADSLEAAKDGVIYVYDNLLETAGALPFHIDDLDK